MTDKIGHIKNPLTIIAIFAGLAEVGGTIVLPLLQESIQAVYVWFLMVFPIFLVGIFFLVLYRKHYILYAPSDYKDDKSFKDILESATPSQRLQRIEEESREIEQLEHAAKPAEAEVSPIKALNIFKNNARSRYLLAEELIFAKLTKLFHWEIERSAIEPGVGGAYFDGLAKTTKFLIAIEIKYNKDLQFTRDNWHHLFAKIRNFHARLTDSHKTRFKLLIAIATEAESARFDLFRQQVSKIAAEYPFNVEIEIYDFNSLLSEFRVE